MDDNKSKGQYIVEILTMIGLGFIMLLFKLVQPFSWTAILVPPMWVEFANELQYAAIEFILMAVICSHFIFGRSFKSMGFERFKENIGTLIWNGIFLGMYVGAVYCAALLSRNVKFDGINAAMTIVTNFIMVALVDEVIFRGFFVNACEAMSKKKGIVCLILTSLLVSFLFAATYIPQIIMTLSTVSFVTFVQALVYPFALSIYLCFIYHFTRNLWACIAIHGVCLSLAALPGDFFTQIFYGAYLVMMGIYLVVSVVRFYKRPQEMQGETWEEEEAEEQEAGEEIDAAQTSQEEIVHDTQSDQVKSIDHDKTEESPEMVNVDIPYFEEVILQDGNDTLEENHAHEENDAQEENDEDEMKDGLTETVTEHSEAEDFDKTMIMPAIVPAHKEKASIDEDDLEKTVIMPAIADDNDETIIMPAVTDDNDETVIMPAITDDNDETMIMPAISDEMIEKAKLGHGDLDNTVVMQAVNDDSGKVISFERRDKKQEKMPDMKVKAEPNFIGHLEKYLGEFDGIFRQQQPTDPPVDIMFFKGEHYNALVTNGMRSMPMEVPMELGGSKYMELMMFLDKSIEISHENIEDEQNAWLIKLLTDLALFPKETGSYLGIGHIVGNGENLMPYSSSSQYCGALIFPPIEQENVRFYRYVEKGNTIYIYNVMPLFKEELGFIQEHSSDQFVNLMSEMGVRQIVKRDRINVIKAMTKE